MQNLRAAKMKEWSELNEVTETRYHTHEPSSGTWVSSYRSRPVVSNDFSRRSRGNRRDVVF